MIPRAILAAVAALASLAAPAGAQDLAGCWVGTIGDGTAQRRAVLQLAGGEAPSGGALHVFGRTLDSDSLTALRATDTLTTFTVEMGGGARRFEGRMSSGTFTGRVSADTSSRPFSFTRVEAGDPALALTGYWRGGLYQNDALVFRMGLEFAPAPCGQVYLTLDSPDQNTDNLPVTSLHMVGDSLEFGMSYVGAAFRGSVAAGATGITGEWAQGGNRLPMRMERSDTAASFARPQDPRPPFPYTAEEVTYRNAGDGTRLAGTLTIPAGEGPFPAVVLITGSGAQDRDESLMGHRPFLVIADHLTRNGIAVLRSDDRGVGGSTGNTMTATLADNAGDVEAAVRLLRGHAKVDSSRVGLIGHSEGGWVAPIVATRSDAVAFVVMLAGPAVSGEDILHAQTRLISEASGQPAPLIDATETVARAIYAILKSDLDSAQAIAAIRALTDTVARGLPREQARMLDSAWSVPGAQEQFEQSLQTLVTPWLRYLLTYDPAPTLDSLRVPVLALFGERDLQVPSAQSLPVLERIWADHRDATIRVIPALNHLFQHAETGLLNEYAVIEETFAPEVLDLMTSWILERFGRR